MTRRTLLLLVFCFSSLAFFSSGILESQDGLQYLTVARNLYYTHSPLSSSYDYPAKNIHMNVTKRADGMYYSPTGAGYSLAMLPAVALSDVLHRRYDVTPPKYFPLESDFSVLWFASFTNIFFASILVVILYHYARLLQVGSKTAATFAILGIVSTNLFPLAKHGFAHMMYITFLVGSFYFIKRYFVTGKVLNLTWSAASFGLVMLAYNPTFILPVPALLLYYFLHLPRPSKNLLEWILEQLKPITATLAGVLPFILFYFWYNAFRTGVAIDSGYGIPADSPFFASPKVLFEGVWGLLLSPGRSFFLYSPLALLPVIFWHKLPWKSHRRELVSWSILAVISIYFFAVQNSGFEWLQWSGESSWGPRYIALLIPFFVLTLMMVWQTLALRAKVLIGVPLLLAGIGVQMLGVLLPYQIKFHTLQPEFQLNGYRHTVIDYGNFIPRYSPLIRMPRELAKRIREFPGTIRHGKYDVRFIDGVDYPFKLGGGLEWRGLFNPAFITFAVPKRERVSTVQLLLANTQLQPDSSYSAKIVAYIQDQKIGEVQVEPEEWEELELNVDLASGAYELRLNSSFVGTSSAQQVVFLRGMSINETPVSLETLDLPYVQPLAQAMSGTEYRYFGEQETTPWFFWHYRSKFFEGTLDLWWVKALYYRDWPKGIFAVAFVTNLVVWLGSGYLLVHTAFRQKSLGKKY